MKKEMVSCMNNTKWREFFEEIEIKPALRGIPFLIKFVRIETSFKEHLSFAEITDVGLFAYWSSLIDKKSEKRNCWLAYADIEWLFFPTVTEKDIYTEQTRNSPPLKTGIRIIETDVSEIKELIDKLGKLTYDFDEDGLRLYGYK